MSRAVLSFLLLLSAGAAGADDIDRVPLNAAPEHSAEFAWASKKVHAAQPFALNRDLWTLDGRGSMSFPVDRGAPAVRVDVSLARQKGMPNATARRNIDRADWRNYNRLELWLRTDVVGFPALTLMVTIRNAGTHSIPEVHRREATHNVTIPTGKWTLVHWEIPHVLRDRVTSLEFRPWVNKILPEPSDRVAYEIRSIRLQRVDPDHYEGWNAAPGRIAFSHTGYLPRSPKIAIADAGAPASFDVLRAGTRDVVLKKQASLKKTRLGAFRVMDFSELRGSGSYILSAGSLQTRPFRISPDAWDSTLGKVVNFFYGQRCGVRVPGVHEACHNDWQAVLGDRSIVMNGGWHDAGDLSQGVVNTGEATHAMLTLASELRASGGNPEMLRLLVDEAQWGLQWIHKVRFSGGFRIGFAGMNLWTNGIIGDEDDRTRVALNNPNVNYIAAAAGAAAYRYFRDSDPWLARKSLQIAEEDWRHAITGVESPETQSTPAFAATPMELAAVGIIASLELYHATGRPGYAAKAQELSGTVIASQQREYVGREFPLAGFFYTAPERKTIFHQFHRATDQAPIVALTLLCAAFPSHPQWMEWYAAAAIHAEYQKRTASTTEPWGVLPAYVYRDDEWQKIEEGDRYGSSRESYREQVLQGMPMGNGYYLRNFPVWFTRRGNYGILLSQAKALSAASRLRKDEAGIALAERQLQWVIGQNPFGQSTMWGEGYDFAPQYSVSVGDLVGGLPVGMMTWGNRDVPYWPATNSYVYKEIWVHPAARWLSVLQDLKTVPSRKAPAFTMQTTESDGVVTVAVTASGQGTHSFALRTSNLKADATPKKITLDHSRASVLKWTATVEKHDTPWVAAVIADGDVATVRDAVGYRP